MKGPKKEEVSLRGFLRFMCEHLRVSYEAITDTSRKKAVISKDTVANALVGATALGVRSLREADFLARGPLLRAFWGGGPSDTTLARVAGGFQGTDRLLRRLHRHMSRQGYLGLGGERVQVIDGSSIGGQLHSVLAEIGSAPALVASEPYPGTGHELSASVRLLGRLASQREAPPDYLLADGLYTAERFWQACERWGTYGLVKTSNEDPLSILQEARLLFDWPVRGEQVGYQLLEGWDARRRCAWRLWFTQGLTPHRRRLSVARVEETFHQGQRGREVFWVLCQDLTIEPLKLLRLMHARWFIENNVFKAFNDQAHSKHCFSHQAHTAEVLMHLQAVAFMALGAYRHWLAQQKHRLRHLWDHHQIPLRLLQSVFRLVLPPVDSS